MTTLKRPGLVFKAETLFRVASPTNGSKYETVPTRNETYIVCQDGTIQARHDPERCIAWNLFEEDNGWSDGNDNELMVSFIEWEKDIIPAGHGSDSTNAYIIEYEDEGEPEVHSDNVL